jgi:hypothetical protein
MDAIPEQAEWHAVEPPDGWLQAWESIHPDVPPPKHYQLGTELVAIVGREPTGPDGQQRWHISVSAKGRIPEWGEMVFAAHSLRPGVPFVMGVPPRSWWMSIHPHVLHMWQTYDANLILEWRDNRRGDTPS